MSRPPTFLLFSRVATGEKRTQMLARCKLMGEWVRRLLCITICSEWSGGFPFKGTRKSRAFITNFEKRKVFVQDFTLSGRLLRQNQWIHLIQHNSHHTKLLCQVKAKTFFQVFFVPNFYLALSEDIFMVRFSSTHRSS